MANTPLYEPESPVIPAAGPADLAALPHPPLTADERAALVSWGFLGQDCRNDWELPVGWSITADANDVGGYGAYQDRSFTVRDRCGAERFRVHESRNPAGIRARIQMVKMPRFAYVLKRVVLKTGEVVDAPPPFASLESLNAELRDPIPVDYFSDHDLYRELGDGRVDGEPTALEVTRVLFE